MRTDIKSRAFTLIELLAVIVLVVVVVAFLFPIPSKPREKSWQVTCLSNEKQLGLGLMQYQQDYDQRFPRGVQPANNGSGWAGAVYPYVKNQYVFKCPDDTASQSVAGGVTLYPVSYAMNSEAVIDRSGKKTPPGLLYVPGDTVLPGEVSGAGTNSTDPQEAGSPHKSPMDFSDNIVWADGDNKAACCNPHVYKYAIGAPADRSHAASSLDFARGSVEVPGPRHAGGSNRLMADGHARWLRGASVAARFQPYGWQPHPPSHTVRAWMAAR